MEYPNWFDMGAKYNFEAVLTQFKDKEDLHYLQLGAFTGDASVWLLDNVLTGKGSKLTDVDTWGGSNEPDHKSMDFADVEKVYDEKINGRTIKQKKTTLDYLTHAVGCSECNYEFDFVYVDADHTAASALIDAELAWNVLKPNGIIAFDDLHWGIGLPPSLTPSLGISLFAERHALELEIIAMNTQAWFIKR